ncbi:MAG TPA: hypothetical protein VGW38_13140, partial [Chloroflexota bacterium]|nr:hypothetical protein [Chloroflexota bacterium]
MAVAHQASEPGIAGSGLTADSGIPSLSSWVVQGRRLLVRLISAFPWRDSLAHLIFAFCAAALLSPALRGTAVHWQDDTKYFYFPLLANLAAALKEGRLPLWEPGIFGGFPLFSDGESGMLYPL